MSTQDPNDGFTDEDLDEAKWCGGTPAAAKKRRLAEDAKCRSQEKIQNTARENYLLRQGLTNEPEYLRLRDARLQREAEEAEEEAKNPTKRGYSFFDRR